jgi:hypothetical protein
MPDVLVAVLGIVGTLLSGTVSFVLGKRWERGRQLLLVRAEMLKPIDEWLGGIERMIGIFADTMVTVGTDSPLPLTYDLEERRKTAQFLSEKTNAVLGILESNALATRRTKRTALELTETIQSIDAQTKYVLIQLDLEVLNRSNRGILTTDFLIQAGETKLKLEQQVRRAHSLIAKLKTAFA